jgi:hypothetical protein
MVAEWAHPHIADLLEAPTMAVDLALAQHQHNHHQGHHQGHEHHAHGEHAHSKIMPMVKVMPVTPTMKATFIEMYSR